MTTQAGRVPHPSQTSGLQSREGIKVCRFKSPPVCATQNLAQDTSTPSCHDVICTFPPSNSAWVSLDRWLLALGLLLPLGGAMPARPPGPLPGRLLHAPASSLHPRVIS